MYTIVYQYYPTKEANWSPNADIWTNSCSPITYQKIDFITLSCVVL